jgi:hypothetical protein
VGTGGSGNTDPDEAAAGLVKKKATEPRSR